MHIPMALLLATLLMVPAVSHAAGEEDEAWIASYMASASAPGLARSGRQARTLEFAQLSGHIGRRVRFTLDGGRERRGLVEGVRGDEVQLRTQLSGGFSLSSVSRRDIRSIQLD